MSFVPLVRDIEIAEKALLSGRVRWKFFITDFSGVEQPRILRVSS
jgi:hypothetical protein